DPPAIGAETGIEHRAVIAAQHRIDVAALPVIEPDTAVARGDETDVALRADGHAREPAGRLAVLVALTLLRRVAAVPADVADAGFGDRQRALVAVGRDPPRGAADAEFFAGPVPGRRPERGGRLLRGGAEAAVRQEPQSADAAVDSEQWRVGAVGK